MLICKQGEHFYYLFCKNKHFSLSLCLENTSEIYSAHCCRVTCKHPRPPTHTEVTNAGQNSVAGGFKIRWMQTEKTSNTMFLPKFLIS